MKKHVLVFSLLLAAFFAGTVSAQQSDLSHPGGFEGNRFEGLSGKPFAAGKPAAAELAEIGSMVSDDGYIEYCDWSPDGNLIAYSSLGDIFVMMPTGGDALNLTANVDGFCYLPNITPDGTGIVYTVQDDIQGTWRVEYVDIGGTVRITLVENALAAVFSPDMNKLVYRDVDSSDLNLYDYETEKISRLDAGEYGYGSACFTYDGMNVIFSKVVGDVRKLFKFNIETGAVKQLTFSLGDHNFPDVSPDGRWIIYTASFTDNIGATTNVIKVLDTASGKEQRLFPDITASHSYARFSADAGSFCYILADTIGFQDIFVTEFPTISTGDPEISLKLTLPNGGENLTAGAQYDIQWTATGATAVNLQYAEFTSDGSLSGRWMVIATNVPASQGRLLWTVPEVEFPYAKIRITAQSTDSTVIADVSDGLFSIGAGSTDTHLRIISPNGGEIWTAGEIKKITWESRNIGTVNIQYTFDGSTYHNVAENVEASSGSYDWVVPNSPGNNCRVRIYDPANLDVTSTSYAAFTISAAVVQPYLRLIAPNGGESLTAGEPFTVKWEARNVGTVALFYSVDNGGQWTPIAIGVNASDMDYAWTVPNVSSTQCRVKIQSEAAANVFYSSYAAFAIEGVANEPFVEVIYPNGGEELIAGEAYTVQWNSAGIDNVHIWYTSDSGIHWYDIASNVTASEGAFSWTVPSDLYGDAMYVSVGDENNDSLYDNSDEPFSVLTPTGKVREITLGNSESYHYATHTVAGVSEGDFYLSIDSSSGTKFYANNGGQLGLTSLGNVGNTDFATVAIPTSGYTRQGVDVLLNNTYVSLAREGETDSFVVFKVIAVGPQSVTIQAVYRVEPGFTLSSINLVSPSNGESITAGSDYTVVWESSGVTNVTLLYSTDGGTVWTTIGTAPATSEAYTWSVPNTIDSNNCLFIVRDADNDIVEARTNDVFTISSEEPHIVLNSPLGGENFTTGEVMTIKWDSARIKTIDILLSLDGGQSWYTIAGAVGATLKRYDWTITSDAESNKCIIKVQHSTDTRFANQSSQFIINPAQTEQRSVIAVDTDFTQLGIQSLPVEGVTGSSLVGFALYARYWTTARSYTVKLTWDHNLASLRSDLSAFAANGQKLEINNTSATFAAENNIFDNNFQKQVLQESEGVYEVEVSLTSSTVSNISLAVRELLFIPVFETVDSFGSESEFVVNVEVSTTGALGVTKTLPVNKFRAIGASTSEPYVTLTSPADNDILEAGSQFTITWEAYNINELVIEYSTDGGANWSTVKDRVSAPLRQTTWQVPDKPSQNCKLRLTDFNEASRQSENPGFFTIQSSAQLQLTAPVENETLIVGQDYYIKWQSMNVQNIKIEINLDGSWYEEVASYPAANGEYYFQILEGMDSDIARIRLTSVADPGLVSLSGVFQITSNDFIRIVSPTSGDRWTVGTKREISWAQKGVSTIKIEISYDSGENFTTLEDSYSADSGMYSLTPDTTSENCIIKVSDTSRPEEIFFTSDSFLIIQPEVTITHQPGDSSLENEPITFNAEITSSSEIETVILTYQNMGDESSQVQYQMESEDGALFSYTLPAGYFGAPGIEYYITATDVAGVEARSPVETGYFSISARVSDIRATEIIRGGSAQNSYRMISVPLEMAGSTIVEQLTTALPVGETGTDWRLFRYPAGEDSPSEYPNTEKFEPGRAFWLISTKDFTLKAAEGTTVTTAEAFQLSLKSGWNDIANPWLFDINWSDIDNPGNAQLSALYTYDGSWSDPTSPPKKLEPWKGYAVRNLESSTKLIFLNSRTSVQKQAEQESAESWRISIRASAGNALDAANHLGVKQYASVEWDSSDHVEPPEIGQFVSVSFPHEDWTVNPYDYTVDFRPPGESLSWDITVRTNIPGETVDVEFSGIESIPEGAYVTLIDRDSGKEIDLSGAGFSFRSARDITEHNYTLIVSDTNPGPEITNMAPEAYVTASSFPNPFNPRTTIHYELSRKGAVLVRVFNTLGQEAARFEPGIQEAGIHELLFDASELTSGLYVYRIDAGFASTTGKMLYMK